MITLIGPHILQTNLEADSTSPNFHAGAGILELAEGSLLAEVAGITRTDALFLAVVLQGRERDAAFFSRNPPRQKL